MSGYIYEHGVPGGALSLKSTNHPGQGHHGDRPLLGKIPTTGPGIEPGTSCLVVRSYDHQTTRLVIIENMNYGRWLHYTEFRAQYMTQIYIKLSTKTYVGVHNPAKHSTYVPQGLQ
jgi:hypothetical protein